MESSEIPELEDCFDGRDINASDRNTNEIGKKTSIRADSDSQLSEETQNLFKKAIEKSYIKQRNSNHTETFTANATESLISNSNDSPHWITNELLSQISSDPEISAWLQNPEKMSLLNKIKTNPMELIASKNTQDKNVIQKISGILAVHFEKLSVSQEQGGNSETSDQTKKPLIEEVLSPEEKAMQERVNSLLADEKVRNALQDEEIRMIIETLRENPEKGHQLATQASKDVKEKIHLLVQKGVLAFQ